jgi:hypothetical protein
VPRPVPPTLDSPAATGGDVAIAVAPPGRTGGVGTRRTTRDSTDSRVPSLEKKKTRTSRRKRKKTKKKPKKNKKKGRSITPTQHKRTPGTIFVFLSRNNEHVHSKELKACVGVVNTPIGWDRMVGFSPADKGKKKSENWNPTEKNTYSYIHVATTNPRPLPLPLPLLLPLPLPNRGTPETSHDLIKFGRSGLGSISIPFYPFFFFFFFFFFFGGFFFFGKKKKKCKKKSCLFF